MVKAMTKDQPEFRDDVMDQIKIDRKVDAEEGDTFTLTGHWEDILNDMPCKTPKSAFLLLKSNSEKEWQRKSLVIDESLLQETFQLPDICLDHTFQLEINGYQGTDPIKTNVDTVKNIPFKVNRYKSTIYIRIYFYY